MGRFRAALILAERDMERQKKTENLAVNTTQTERRQR